MSPPMISVDSAAMAGELTSPEDVALDILRPGHLPDEPLNRPPAGADRFQPLPLDGASGGNCRFFRATDTTGAVQFFEVYQGKNTATR